MVPFATHILEEARQHALDEYPYECCGIVIGKPDSAQEDILFRCKNIQNELHEQDPRNYPRDARTAYTIDPRDFIRVDRQAREKQLSIKLFYHSHPEHDAYFSAEDKRMALFDGEPTYPEARYLVISVYNKAIRDQALFGWNPDSKKFEQQPL